MLIAVDATAWTNPRGFGRFTRSLVRALVRADRSNEYALVFDRGYDRCEDVPTEARHVVVPTTELQDAAVGVDRHRSARDMWRMARAVMRLRADVFFCPSVDGYFAALPAGRRVVAIHDTIPEEHGAMMLPSAAARARRRLKVRVALAQAARIATGSAYMSRRVARVFGLAPERVGVIPYAADGLFQPPEKPDAARHAVRTRHGLDRPYLLHVGGFGPNKNLPRLVEAFAGSGTDALLVFVGDRRPDAGYPEHAALDGAIARTGLADRVRFLGYLPDEELVPLYQAAEATAVPSLEEGYGLPGLESVACGTPVLATRASPLPEELGAAAIAVDPHDTRSLTAAIERLLDDPAVARQHRAAARAASDQHRWEASAHQAMELFEYVSR